MSEIERTDRIPRLMKQVPLGVTKAGSVAENEPSVQARPMLQIRLLGGFQLERVGPVRAAISWERRGAKTLMKLLATHPRHFLHREQIMEILWPGVDRDSSLNSFGKTLHAARRALEPELPPRSASAYLRLTDSMLVLRTENVVIDADRWRRARCEART